MKTTNYNRYSYAELLGKATAPGAGQIDIDTLGAWFADFGTEYWNCEYYDADGSRLFPIYSVPDEFGDVEITGYEFR